MDKAKWKRRIKKSCEEAGTYRPFFDDVIDTLAGIMELRDNALEMYAKMGAQTVVKMTNKGGHENLVKHPAMVVLMDLNAQALSYWRDLGLTPAGYKKLNADVVEKKSEGSFEKLLAQVMA